MNFRRAVFSLLGLFFFHSSALAFWVGNPADPVMMKKGILFSDFKGFSLRSGFLYDQIFHSTFNDEFASIESEPSSVKLNTFAAVVTANIASTLDVYGILGGAQMGIDDSMYLPRRFAWGAGARAIIFETRKFKLSADLKYFYTVQEPEYFVIDNNPATLLTEYSLSYREWQAALSATVRFGVFYPYLGITYLQAKINPSHSMGVIEVPNFEMGFEFDSRSAINQDRWGGVAGITVVSAKTISLSIESRFINQTAVNVSAEIRF
jgi:hypothetical protein